METKAIYTIEGLEGAKIVIKPYAHGYFYLQLFIENGLFQTQGTPRHMKKYVENIVTLRLGSSYIEKISHEFGDDLLNL